MKKLIITVSVLGAVLIACQKNAITGRRSLNLVPESEMMTMSYSEYDKFLSQNKPLPETDKRVTMVRAIGVKKIGRAHV